MMFPSPHSGILFLFRAKNIKTWLDGLEFPSPHSGILFL